MLTALKQSGFTRSEALDNLRLVISAGSPLSSEISRWFRGIFPNRVGLFSGSGGTDLVGGSKYILVDRHHGHGLTLLIVISGNCLSVIHDGELASPQLGMKVEVWDLEGRNVDQAGEKGDLVITTPFFSMPITFYGDGGLEKYYKAYFDKFPGVWCHGDFAQRNPATGGYVILGRSDGVLNPGGWSLSH